MKRTLLTAIITLATFGIASAQKYCVIDSEKVFKSLDEYNKAIAQLDELGKSYQAEVDSKYKSIESLYNSYMEQKNNLSASTRQTIEQQILQKEQEAQKYQQELFGEDGARELERVVLLRNVDEKWMDHLEAMDDLRDSIGLQAYAQRNPLNEYKIAGAELFDDMIIAIRDDTVRGILTVIPREKAMERVQVVKPTEEGFMKLGQRRPQKAPTQAPVRNENKVGRNDPCPCGSGKKYKKCCGASSSEGEE